MLAVCCDSKAIDNLISSVKFVVVVKITNCSLWCALCEEQNSLVAIVTC